MKGLQGKITPNISNQLAGQAACTLKEVAFLSTLQKTKGVLKYTNHLLKDN